MNKVICKECKHHRGVPWGLGWVASLGGAHGVFQHVCVAKEKKDIDYVTGKIINAGNIYCLNRNHDGNCKLYEGKK